MRYSYDNLEMTVTYRKDKEIEIRVANHNTFRVGNITVTTEYAGKNGQSLSGESRRMKHGRAEIVQKISLRFIRLPFMKEKNRS